MMRLQKYPDISSSRYKKARECTKIYCFFTYTIRPGVSKLSSSTDYILDLARASFLLFLLTDECIFSVDGCISNINQCLQ